jgi:hypothetical protein
MPGWAGASLSSSPRKINSNHPCGPFAYEDRTISRKSSAISVSAATNSGWHWSIRGRHSGAPIRRRRNSYAPHRKKSPALPPSSANLALIPTNFEAACDYSTGQRLGLGAGQFCMLADTVIRFAPPASRPISKMAARLSTRSKLWRMNRPGRRSTMIAPAMRFRWRRLSGL